MGVLFQSTNFKRNCISCILRHKLVTVITTIICISVLQMGYGCFTETNFDDGNVTWIPKNRIVSCHEERENDDAFELLETTVVPEKSIFFYETACKGGLSSRQACAVESAARAHPHHQINVVFSSTVTREMLMSSSLKILLQNYTNVKFSRVLIKKFARDTPIKELVTKMNDYRLTAHISKMLKYLTMYKYSGISLSLDTIVARPLKMASNWALRDTPGSLSSDNFAFSANSVGRKLAVAALGFLQAEMKLSTEHDFWSYNGPTVMLHVLQNWCTTTKVQAMNRISCEDLAVLGPELFYPISFHNRQAYFHEVDEKWEDNIPAYTYVSWEQRTKYNIALKNSLLERIAAKYCPLVREHYGEDFGLWYPW